MGIERRVHQRFDVSFDVRLKLDAEIRQARISNISLGGCYIETELNVKLRSVLEIEMLLMSGYWLPLSGTVMYYNPQGGIGLRFEFRSETEQNLIERLIEHISSRSHKHI